MNESLPRRTAPTTAATAHAVMRGRRSIRSYRPESPPDDVIDRIFASAATAPSAHNRQPWRYLVIREAALKAKLAEAMGAQLAADRRADGDSDDAIVRDVARSFQRIAGAPVVILVALTMAEMDRYPDPARARAEFLMAVQSTAMATQNLLLAAHAEGFGTCWMCAPLFCPATVREALPIPMDWEPQGLVTLGWPDGAGKPKRRKPLSDFVLFADGPTGPMQRR
jgi:coenzyme F420-0:L-glutamate ligase/coenzyme F420-1:gamma-L-glutamate ligase